MSKSNTWDKLSKILSSVLSDSVGEDERENVMEAWGNQKSVITKIMNSDSSDKKQKDPNAPKRGKSNYIFFCMDRREKVKTDNNELSAKEITTLLGKMWKDLSDKKKVVYNNLAIADRDRYLKESAEYVPPEGSNYAVPKSKKVRVGPKRPLSSYMHFCAERRPQLKAKHPELTGTDFTKRLGEEWNALVDKQKVKYVKMLETDRARYEREKSQMSDSSTSKKSKSSKTVETIQEEPKKVSKKTKKTSPGYEFFVAQEREDVEDENPDWSERKISSHLLKMWNALHDEDRDSYEMEADEEEEFEASEC